MGVRPEDRPKVIALIAAIVVFLAYFFIAVLPRLVSPQQAAAPTAGTVGPVATAPVPAATVPAPVAGNTAQVATNLPPVADTGDLNPDAPIPPATRDPFRPPVAPPSAAPAAKPAPAVKTASAATPISPAVPPANSLPATVAETPAAGKGLMAIPTGAVRPLPVQPPTPDVKLQGVLPGSPAIAVVLVGDKTVQKEVGEKIDGGLILKRIDDSSVTLTRGKQAVVLEVGQSLRRSPQEAGSVAVPPLPGQTDGEIAFVAPAGNSPVRQAPPVVAAVRKVPERAPGHASGIFQANAAPVSPPDLHAIVPRRYLHRSLRRSGSRRGRGMHHARRYRHHGHRFHRHHFHRHHFRRWHRVRHH